MGNLSLVRECPGPAHRSTDCPGVRVSLPSPSSGFCVQFFIRSCSVFLDLILLTLTGTVGISSEVAHITRRWSSFTYSCPTLDLSQPCQWGDHLCQQVWSVPTPLGLWDGISFIPLSLEAKA